jgi:hypothetical protein
MPKEDMSIEEIENALDSVHIDPFIEELSKYREANKDIDEVDQAGYTWLTRAIISNYYNPYDGCIATRMKAVLLAGANPDKADDDTIPLVYACGWQFGYGLGPSSNLVRILLESGANPSPVLDINMPSTYINEDGDIDFSDTNMTHITTIDSWLADIEYHNDLIEEKHIEYNVKCVDVRKELTEIRQLLEESRSGH